MQAILYSSNFHLQQFSPPAIIFLEIFSQAIFVARNFLDKELFFPQLFSGNFQSRNYFMPIFMQSSQSHPPHTKKTRWRLSVGMKKKHVSIKNKTLEKFSMFTVSGLRKTFRTASQHPPPKKRES